MSIFDDYNGLLDSLSAGQDTSFIDSSLQQENVQSQPYGPGNPPPVSQAYLDSGNQAIALANRQGQASSTPSIGSYAAAAMNGFSVPKTSEEINAALTTQDKVDNFIAKIPSFGGLPSTATLALIVVGILGVAYLAHKAL